VLARLRSIFAGVRLVGDTEVDQEFFQLVDGNGLRDDEHGVAVDLFGQGAIFVGLGMLGRKVDDGFAVDLGALHLILTGHEVDHLGAQALAELLDHLSFLVDLTAVADDAAQAHAAGIGVLHDALADVVGGVHGHHLAGADDVDFLGLAVADRHGEPAADNVAEDVVEGVVQVFVVLVGAELFEQVDGGDDAAAGATDARLRAAGFRAHDAAEAFLEDGIEFDVLAFLTQGVEDGLLRQAVQEQAGGVGFGVATDDHDFFTHLGQAGDGILCGRGLADAALPVDSDLTHFVRPPLVKW